jgi:hypothetical protein
MFKKAMHKILLKLTSAKKSKAQFFARQKNCEEFMRNIFVSKNNAACACTGCSLNRENKIAIELQAAAALMIVENETT